MNIHPFDVVASTPLRGVLHPHEIVPSIEVDAEQLLESDDAPCDVLDCRATRGGWLLAIHQAHSRNASDAVVLCDEHLTDHRSHVPLWVLR